MLLDLSSRIVGLGGLSIANSVIAMFIADFTLRVKRINAAKLEILSASVLPAPKGLIVLRLVTRYIPPDGDIILVR